MTLLFFIQPLHSKVLLGIDVLERNRFDILNGKTVGLITNHTGRNRKGRSTIDILYKAPGVKLVRLFSPEHGIRGKMEHGKLVSNDRDPVTGLPVFSLYGKTRRPTDEMLKGLDALVFDIQDIGTRFYTYTTTLAYALEEAGKRNIEFIVLDRPNPITGTIVEGEPLSPDINHFTAYLRVPVRHAMTVGELAHFHNRTTGLNANLTVVKLEGWRREMWLDDAGFTFRPTSPNMTNLRAAALYPGIGGFEATNVSVGRGTGRPFEMIGAPWMDAKDLSERLNFLYMPGAEFRPAHFRPKDDLYKGELCEGVSIKIKDRDALRSVDVFVQIFMVLREQYPENFVVRWDEMRRITGSGDFERRLQQMATAETLLVTIHQAADNFRASRKPYLLYPESKIEE